MDIFWVTMLDAETPPVQPQNENANGRDEASSLCQRQLFVISTRWRCHCVLIQQSSWWLLGLGLCGAQVKFLWLLPKQHTIRMCWMCWGEPNPWPVQCHCSATYAIRYINDTNGIMVPAKLQWEHIRMTNLPTPYLVTVWSANLHHYCMRPWHTSSLWV